MGDCHKSNFRQKKADIWAGVPIYRLQALYFQGEKINNSSVGGIDRYLKPIETLQKKSVPDKRIILILVLKRNILC